MESDSVSQNNAPGDKIIFINVIKVIAIVIGVIVLLLLLITAIAFSGTIISPDGAEIRYSLR